VDNVAQICSEIFLKVAQFSTGINKRYPIRESSALDVIAKALNFANRAQYEMAVRNLLSRDIEAVKRVRTLLGSFPVDLVD